tara:strand:- start:569 stop:1405 length:837 start_codon:yes stop_codon:yes gene_type:complete
MTSFNDIEFNKIDLPFISGINDKKGIRLFYKNNNIHDDIIIKLAPCLCPFGLKTFNNISIVTCSLANSSRKRIKDIKSFENKIESKLYKLYPQFKQYSLKSFIDDQYRFSLSVNLNDIRVFDQKLNLLDRDSIRPQCFIEPAICLYEIWIKTEERRWGLNCKLLQCKIFSPFISPTYCLFNKDITNIKTMGLETDKLEKMKKIGVPDEAISHYCKKNNIISEQPTRPKLNFTPGDLLGVKLKPVSKQNEKPIIKNRPMVFRPPSVNELLDMKNKLKKV